MRRFRLLLCFAAVSFALDVRAADEAPSALDALLSDWSTASRNCTVLDTKFTIIFPDAALGDRTETGRLYFEASDLGCFQVGNNDAIVWQSGHSLILANAIKKVDRISSKQAADLRRREADLPSLGRQRSWFADIQLHLLRWYLTQPRDAIPCLLMNDTDGFRAKYDLKLGEIEGKPWLTATPKSNDERGPDKLQFIFNSDTHLPEAVKENRRGVGERVFVLYETRLGEKPADRDKLLEPDLKDWKSQPVLDGD